MQSCVVLTLLLQQHDESPFQLLFITLCAKLSNAVYCNRSCLFDPHHTGFVGKGSDHLQLIKFWLSCAHGQGVCGGAKNFGSTLLQPAHSVCVSPSAFLFGLFCWRLQQARLGWTGSTEEELWGLPKYHFTGQMPFLSPNQQCQSTEGVNSMLSEASNDSRRRGGIFIAN